MIDILRHIAKEIGPCRIDIGTWTAGHEDLDKMKAMLVSGEITGLRMILGSGYATCRPKDYERLLSTIGRAHVRFARFHAKYALLENDKFTVALRTSMNLNKNIRIESYEISEGSKISDYLRQIADHHFASDVTAYEALKSFDIAAPTKTEQPQQRLSGWD